MKRYEIKPFLDVYLAALASGVLLAELVEPYFPIHGLAIVYLVGGLVWSGVRRIVPPPDDDR